MCLDGIQQNFKLRAVNTADPGSEQSSFLDVHLNILNEGIYS